MIAAVLRWLILLVADLIVFAVAWLLCRFRLRMGRRRVAS